MEASHLSKMLPFYVSVNHASVCNSTCVRVSYQHFNITCRILYVLTYIRGGHGRFAIYKVPRGCKQTWARKTTR